MLYFGIHLLEWTTIGMLGFPHNNDLMADAMFLM